MGRRRQYEDSMYEQDDFEDDITEPRSIFSNKYDALLGIIAIAAPFIIMFSLPRVSIEGYEGTKKGLNTVLLFGLIIAGLTLLKAGKIFTSFNKHFSTNEVAKKQFKAALIISLLLFPSLAIYDFMNKSRIEKKISEGVSEFEANEKKSIALIRSMTHELERQKEIIKPLVDEYCSPQQRNLDAFRKLLSEARDTATFQAMSKNIEYAIKSWVSCVKDIERSKGFDYQALEAKINSAKDAHNEKFSYLKKDEIKNSVLGLTSKK